MCLQYTPPPTVCEVQEVKEEEERVHAEMLLKQIPPPPTDGEAEEEEEEVEESVLSQDSNTQPLTTVPSPFPSLHPSVASEVSAINKPPPLPPTHPFKTQSLIDTHVIRSQSEMPPPAPDAVHEVMLEDER